MLRLTVLLLVLANAGYWAWSQGLLAAYGLAPAVQSEPQRMATQIRPEAIRLLTPDEAKKLETGPASVALAPTAAEAPAAPECLQAGMFNEQQTATLRASLETALPAGSWQFESSIECQGKRLFPGPLARCRTKKCRRSWNHECVLRF